MIELRVLASGSSGNCLWVTDGRTELLLDAGISAAAIREGLSFGLTRVAGCLISHEHGDHAKAVKDVLRAGVDVYMSAGTAKALNLEPSHRLHCVGSRTEFTVGTFTVLTFETVHDAEEPLGFLLASGTDRLLYLTDTAYCRFRFKGLTHLVIECNYSLDTLKENVADGVVDRALKSRVLHSHTSLETCKQFLAKHDLDTVREIHLIHMSDNNSDEERFKREIEQQTGKPVMCW